MKRIAKLFIISSFTMYILWELTNSNFIPLFGACLGFLLGHIYYLIKNGDADND